MYDYTDGDIIYDVTKCENCNVIFGYPRMFRGCISPVIDCPWCGYRNDVTIDFEDLEVSK